MADIGHEVTLLIPKRYNPIALELFVYYGVKKNITTVYYPTVDIMRFWSQGFYVLRLAEMFFSFLYVLRLKKVEIIYSRDEWMLLLPVLCGKGKQCIFEVHTKHTQWAIREVIKRVRSVAAISVGLKSFYENFGLREGIILAPSGVDIEQFTCAPEIGESRRVLQLPSDKIILGYVGKYSTMGESKGVDEIVQAFAIAYRKDARLHLLIAGLEPREITSLNTLVATFELPMEAYSFRDLQPEKFSTYLIASDILLMNYPQAEHYAYYMSPTKLFAYLAAGKPIVSSDLPSIRSIAGEDLITYVAADSVKEYVKGIQLTVADLVRLNSLSKQRKVLAQQYEWKMRAQKILGKN